VGYASLFAIWWITKDVMSPGQNLVIAVMMIGSVGAFVGNELFNVFMMNRIANMIPTATAKPDRNAMMQFLTSLQAVAAGSVKYKGLRQWVLRTSLAMAGIAVAVMLYSMLKNLWAIYAHSY
jgi:hypothetical protein